MKIGRNEKCICGSEKKYKPCCLNKASTIKLQIKNLSNKKSHCTYKFSSDETLYDLHSNILAKNGWTPEHAFSFFMSNKFWDTENKYSENAFEVCNSGVKVKKFNFKQGDTFFYLYDWGNEHRFEISVLNVE
jgi:hypothetical protein